MPVDHGRLHSLGYSIWRAFDKVLGLAIAALKDECRFTTFVL
jgi:hypothetical protein